MFSQSTNASGQQMWLVKFKRLVSIRTHFLWGEFLMPNTNPIVLENFVYS